MIVLHGPAGVHNESLVYVLSHEFHTNCELSPDLGVVVSIIGQARSEDGALLLVDASGRNHEPALLTLESRMRMGASGPTLAIYNLPRGIKIEAETLRKGVRGVFYTEDTLTVFLKGIHSLLKGEVWMSHNTLLELALSEPLFSLAQVAEASGLSKREIEILAHASRGESNDEIAELLCLSSNTVKTHLYNIYRKINVNNRFQASLWAARHIK